VSRFVGKPFGYNAALNPNSVNLPTGASADSDYNYDNLSSTSTVTYDDLGTSRTITSTTHSDGWGRVIDTVAPNNGQMNTSYDAMGRVTSRTNPFTAGGSPGPATTTQYNIANRAVITTLPDGNTTRSDFSGTIVTLTDQVNRKIKRETDGLGRLTKVTEQTSAGALTQETTYSYSLLDKLTLVNQGNQGRAYKYDAMGRLLYEKIPEQTATINDGTGTYWTSAYAYTEYSALKKRTDARGVESHYAYDALHQVTSIWYTGVGGDDAGYVRPALPSGVAAIGDRTFGYTSWGAISSVTIPSEYSETYAFDGYARPTSVTRWILGQAYSIYKTYTTAYEYNQGSQLTKMIYPSGQQVVVNHDDKGRVQSLSGVTGLSYNIAGQVTGLTLGNGVVESYGYDANRLQLTSQTATKSGNQLMNLTYNYQATAGQMGAGSTAGNAGQLMSISGTINSTTESSAYTYDLLGRLITSNQSSNGSSAQRLFEYDRWGNRTAVYNGLPGGKTPPTQIQSLQLQQSGGVPTNRITSVTNSGSTVNYVYDAAGNVTNDGAHAYTYDVENRVVNVDGGVTAQYKYDYQNRRVTKTVGSSWTHYIWEGAQVIGEHDATTPVSGYGQPPYQEQSARVDYVYAGSRMIRSRQRTSSTGPWTTRYYLSDRLSVRMTLDTSGNVLGRQAHLPFGEDFGESGTQEKHHFTTFERDLETALDYAINRYDNVSLGRFQSADPYRASGYIVDPQSWNRYSYVRNDPIGLVDPTGQWSEGGGFPDIGDYSEWGPIGPVRPGSPAPWRTDRRGGGGGRDDPPIDFPIVRSSDKIMKAADLVMQHYAECRDKVFGNANDFGGKSVPSSDTAIFSLIAGFLQADISAMVAAIWAIESNYLLFPNGDHGPAQLTAYWKRRKPGLVVPGSYDTFPRRRGSPNRERFFAGDPLANLMTLGNILRWTKALYGSWNQVAYWYGPGDQGAVSRSVYEQKAMELFGKYKDFFRCLKKGAN
jgi:RHS repeat-associated protein